MSEITHDFHSDTDIKERWRETETEKFQQENKNMQRTMIQIKLNGNTFQFVVPLVQIQI